MTEAETTTAPGQPPRRGLRRYSLRGQISVSLVVAVGLPLLAASAVGTSLLYQREAEATRASLFNIAMAQARQVEAHLFNHLAVVREAAAHAQAVGTPNAAALGAVLERVRSAHPEFLSLLATDASGWILAVDPSKDRSGLPLLSSPKAVRDREYFQVPMFTGSAHVSGVFRGRGLGSDPIVAVSAPVMSGRRIAGVVEGSLDVSRIPLVQGLESPASYEVVILDGADQAVVASPGSPYAPLQPLAEAPEGQARRRAGVTLAQFQRTGQSYLMASAALKEGGWHALILVPASAVGRGTLRFVTTVAVTLLVGVILALLLGVILARRLTAPLEHLQRAVATFLSGAPSAPFLTPPSAPQEISDLVDGYTELQRRVGRTLSGLLPVCAWCRRIRDDAAGWQPLEVYVQRFESEVTHGMCPDCERRLQEISGG